MFNNRVYNAVVFIVVLMIQLKLSAQEGISYQATMITNPSLTGSAGSGIARLSYLNLYPGNNYNFHTVLLSYDSYFPELHGGAGFYMSEEYLGGIINNLRGGFSYSYFLQAGRDFFICGGLSASFYHRGYDFSNGVLPDQIDPVMGAIMPSGETLPERGRTVPDLATGFLFMSGKYFAGFSVDHLAEPDPSVSDFVDGSLKRTLLVHAGSEFTISRDKSLRVIPVAAVLMAKGSFKLSAGASVENKYLSVNALLLTDNWKNTDLQAGFSVTAGNLMIFYNYRFNIISGENLLPFSLLHHTGIALSLNAVDKRKPVKTINFPKL